MAGAARLTLCHLRHRIGWILFGHDMKDIVVAGRAVTANSIKMIVVAEFNLSVVCSLDIRLVLDPAGISGRCDENDENEQQQITQFHDTLHAWRLLKSDALYRKSGNLQIFFMKRRGKKSDESDPQLPGCAIISHG